jgi:hypothetical protein
MAIPSAPPGHFISVVGTGPDGDPESDPGWFEDPVDLAPAPGGGIFVLTKEYARVFLIHADGSHQQQFSLSTPGEALSMTLQPDGSILVAQRSHKTGNLALWRLQQGRAPDAAGEYPPPKNWDSVHLIRTPDQEVLLLKDGWFFQQEGNGKYEPLQHPHGLSTKNPVLAAAPDGSSLMLLTPTSLIWLQHQKIVRQVRIAGLDTHDGAAISPDGAGGAFKARYGQSIDHYSKQGHEGYVLLGYGNAPSCGKGPVFGTTGDGRDQRFGEATALLFTGKQLYFADPQCHRVLAIGLPAKEYANPN